ASQRKISSLLSSLLLDYSPYFFLSSTDSPSKDRLVFFLLPRSWTSDKVALARISSDLLFLQSFSSHEIFWKKMAKADWLDFFGWLCFASDRFFSAGFLGAEKLRGKLTYGNSHYGPAELRVFEWFSYRYLRAFELAKKKFSEAKGNRQQTKSSRWLDLLDHGG
ncbi:MAG TPA: hypothetical protein PKD96_03755, partial [Candidatus Absconditabacterales bacterium]|nr:hypothetical protein [Candidatus Absconditabacterales bacterium]